MFDEFNDLILKPVRFPLEEKVAKSKEEILKEDESKEGRFKINGTPIFKEVREAME